MSYKCDGSEVFVGLKFGMLNIPDTGFLASFLNHLHDIG
jgi:hypothetical protein